MSGQIELVKTLAILDLAEAMTPPRISFNRSEIEDDRPAPGLHQE